MEAYTSFARVYDMFMDNVPYEVWGRYIVEKLRANGIDSGYVVDLGCGTGKLTTLLADAGYDMIGIDNSFDMLDMALEREDDRILFHCKIKIGSFCAVIFCRLCNISYRRSLFNCISFRLLIFRRLISIN